jgi:hypothetical protein
MKLMPLVGSLCCPAAVALKELYIRAFKLQIVLLCRWGSTRVL